jgi:hypothetical protein
MAKGLQFHVKGWSGSIVIDDGVDTVTVTPSDASSPFEVLEEVASECQSTFGGTWTASVDSSFFLSLTSSGAGTWDASFGGTTYSLMGFSSSYSGVSSITASGIATGGFYPYSDGDGLVYVLDARLPGSGGIQTFDAAFWYNTPGTNHRNPIVNLSVLRSLSLSFVEAAQSMGTPAKVQIVDDSGNPSFFVGNIRTSERNAIDGWTQIQMELVR